MKFTERKVEFPNRKKIKKISENDDEIIIDMERAEGDVIVEGTKINAELLEKVNWRDDRSISFAKLNSNELPQAVTETQIVTKANGETWVIPPFGLGEAKEIGAGQRAAQEAVAAAASAKNSIDTFIQKNGTVVEIGMQAQPFVSFSSNPQTQLDALNSKFAQQQLQSAENLVAVNAKIDNLETAVYDTGWVDLTLTSAFQNYGGDIKNRLRIRKIGNVVNIRGAISPKSNSNNIGASSDDTHTTNLVCTVPPEFIPSGDDVRALHQGSGNNIFLSILYANWYGSGSQPGDLRLSRYRAGTTLSNPTSGNWLTININYII